MSENTPDVVGFERMETQLVREAVRSAGELYIEEIARTAIKHYRGDKAKRDEYITNAWTFATTFDLFHLLNHDNLKKLWEKMRTSIPLSAAVLNTAVKLRGMYSESDWSSLVFQLAAGLDAMHANSFSVMDDTATKPLEGTAKPTDRIGGNLWVVPLVLLSYAPLVSLPGPLAALARAADTPAPQGSVS